MTYFEEIKAKSLDEFAEFLTALQITIIETMAKKFLGEYEVSKDEKSELLKEIKQGLESEVPSND